MSDTGNSVEVASSFATIEEAAGFFGSSEIVDDRCFFKMANDRQVRVDFALPPLLFTRPGAPDPDLQVFFGRYPKYDAITEEMVADEVAVAISCIMAQDRIRSGAYFHNDAVLAQWDWDGAGLELTSIRWLWELPESRVLRHRLHGAGIRYEVKKVERILHWETWLRARDQEGSWDDLGTLPEPEGWTIFGQMLAVGSVLEVATGVDRHTYQVGLSVDLPTLRAFIRDVIDTAENNPDVLEPIAEWRSALVGATAILRLGHIDAPPNLSTDRWEQVRAEAEAFAHDLRERDE